MSLDSLSSVRSGAASFLQQGGGQVNAIIGNAGIMACPYSLTTDGFESQFGTDHLSHFLLFHLLKEALLASATPEYPSRYVSVSSIAHILGTLDITDYNYQRSEYDPWKAYAAAKTANIWFANSIERHFGTQHLHATSVHPGGIQETGLDKHLTEETKKAMFSDPGMLRTFKNAEQGAATQVYAAVSREWAHEGGRYLSSLREQKSREEVRGEEGMYEDANEGYAAWAYDEEKEEKLWVDSLGMVGLKE